MAIQLYAPAVLVPLKLDDFAVPFASSATVLVKIGALVHAATAGLYSEMVTVPPGSMPLETFTVSKITVPVTPPGDGVEVRPSECLPMGTTSLSHPLRASVLLLSPP